MQNFFKIINEHQNTSVALGYFDGVHLGHRSVISGAAGERANGLIPVCFTFAQSPKSVITGKALPMLMTAADKLKALEALGTEQTVQADFKSLMNMSSEEFVKEILSKKLRAKKLFCGFNYRFGKNGSGDTLLLEKLCGELGITLEVMPPALYEGKVISSTRIRRKIADGDIETANKMLGGRFGFCSVIEHGKRLGRTLGTPTINQPLIEGLAVPKFGVYASAVTLENGKVFCGVTNIGIKPTVGASSPLCETWMPDYRGKDIYGQTADIRLLGFIREEKKFSGLDELKNTIIANSENAKQIFKHNFVQKKA